MKISLCCSIDELADVGRPALELLRLGADAGALLEALIGPDMDDPVQRADFGVPEGGERRQLRPRRQRLAEALFDGRDRARLHGIGAEFDDHRVSSVVPREVDDPGERPDAKPPEAQGEALMD